MTVQAVLPIFQQMCGKPIKSEKQEAELQKKKKEAIVSGEFTSLLAACRRRRRRRRLCNKPAVSLRRHTPRRRHSSAAHYCCTYCLMAGYAVLCYTILLHSKANCKKKLGLRCVPAASFSNAEH